MGYSRYQGRLLTRYSPVRHSTRSPKKTFAFDLHVLSTPPAFVLSQDQTLQFDILDRPKTVSYIVLNYIRARFLNYENLLKVSEDTLGPFAVCCYSVVKDRSPAKKMFRGLRLMSRRDG